MGDTAICVNPNDKRYKHLQGAFAFVPLINRRIPIIFDEYVDLEFGTGALKVTPAHDINDYNLGLKHNLEVVDTINEDGTMSAAAQIYVGEDRFAARKKIIKELEEKGFLTKEEEYTTRLGYSQRTGVVVEPRISTQWFVKMKELAEPALKAVVDGDIKIHPGDKFLATYKYWLENVKDWCISRQLWWGQQIPAWYDEEGKMVVAETKEEAFEQFKIQNSKFKIEDIRQDADVLDTWFSSWLWPTQVFKGITDPGNEEVKYYYPGSVLVTGQDIIFFWVARMVMAGLEYEKQIPFKDVYFTGMVRDKLGRKMSKQLGNSPDLLDLIDKYGADAVRFGIMVSSPAGNDLMFDENSLEQGRNFNNKIWNALKLLKMWEGRQSTIGNEQLTLDTARLVTFDPQTVISGDRLAIGNEQSSTENTAIKWFENKLNQVRAEVDSMMQQFRLSEALKTIYSLIWDDFCSWYLEWVKPDFEKAIDNHIYEKTVYFFEQLMQLLHPFMPFVTEEIYHLLRDQKDDLCIKQFKPIEKIDDVFLCMGEDLKLFLTGSRETKSESNLKQSDVYGKMTIPKTIFGEGVSVYNIIKKQLKVEEIVIKETETFFPTLATAIVYPFKGNKVFFEIDQKVDQTKLKEELLKDLEHQKGFLASVEKKLSNQRFVQNAKPEVIALEKKKKADAEARIKTIEESLSTIS
jgi:valyl-tRNA synthetase